MSVGGDHLLYLIAEHVYVRSAHLQGTEEQSNMAGFKAPCYGSFCHNPALPPAEE